MCRLSLVPAMWLVALLCASPAGATAITFSGSSGSLSASATFENSGTNLIVTLTNTSPADASVPVHIFTAVFFNVAGNLALTRTSAVVPATSSVLFGATDPGGVVGGEWAYSNSLSQYGANSGIGSAGLGIFGPFNRFPGTNLQGPDSPNGIQYGITSAGDNPATGNSAVTGKNALIKNQVVFTLGNWTLGDPTGNLTNVTFQYGTALSEPHFTTGPPPTGTVPEPAGLTLLGTSLALAARRLRRKKS